MPGGGSVRDSSSKQGVVKGTDTNWAIRDDSKNNIQGLKTWSLLPMEGRSARSGPSKKSEIEFFEVIAEWNPHSYKRKGYSAK